MYFSPGYLAHIAVTETKRLTESRFVDPWRTGTKAVATRNRVAVRASLALAILLGGLGAGAAQTALEDSVARRQRPDYDPIGIVAGPADSFLFFPKFELAGEYTDNLFKTQIGEISDEILLLTPSFKLRSDWDSHALSLSGTASRAMHKETSDENWIDYRFDLDGRLDILDAGKATGQLSWRRNHENRGSPDDPALTDPTIFHVGTLKLGGAYGVDAVALRLDLTMRRYDFRDTGPVNNDDRDRIESEVRGRVGYEWVPGSSAFVEAAFDIREFDDSVDDLTFQRSSDGYEVLVGNTLDLSGVTFAELGLGYREQRFDDPRLKAAAGFSFDGRLYWNPTDLLSVSARARRLVRETTVLGASSTLSTILGLTADYEPFENLIFDASADYELQDFRGIARDDTLIELGVGGRYLIGPNIHVGVKYDLEKRNSDTAGGSYSANSLRLFASVQF